MGSIITSSNRTGRLYRCPATLVWHRPKTSPTSSGINDLDLFLFNAANNTLVTNSQSQVDNVEHVFVRNLMPGRYALQVLKHGGLRNLGSDVETYALVFDFAAADAPRFVNVAVAGGQFQARLLGAPNQTYVIETSPDFANWVLIASNTTNAEGFFDFASPLTAGAGFYRAHDQ